MSRNAACELVCDETSTAVAATMVTYGVNFDGTAVT